MAWMELHQTMPRHPKTLKLARLLGVKRREACGILIDLWTWALDVSDTNGRLDGIISEDIADALDYPRKKGEWLVSALVDATLFDVDGDTYILHNWNQYAGKLNDKRESDRQRKVSERTGKKSGQGSENSRNSDGCPAETQCVSDGCPTDVQRNSDGCPSATVPNLVEVVVKDAHAREAESPPDNIVAFCQANFPAMNDAAYQELADFMDNGITPEMVELAVNTTRANNSMAWSYARSIMDSWVINGIKTLDAAKTHAAQFKARSNAVANRPQAPPSPSAVVGGEKWA